MKSKKKILERIEHHKEQMVLMIERRDKHLSDGNEIGYSLCNEKANIELERKKSLEWVLEDSEVD